jgi:hypothetical protein
VSVIIEIFLFDFLPELFFDLVIDIVVILVFSYDKRRFGVIGLLKFTKLPFSNRFDKLRQVNISIKVSKIFHKMGHFFMRIVLIEFLFDELLFTVTFSKGSRLLRFEILFLFDSVTDVLEEEVVLH